MENVKKYRVIALNVGADSNKIFYAGEEVNADAWAEPGMADRLVQQGFLALIEEPKKVEVIKHKLTEEDLSANPDLVKEGLKAGDEIELPKEGFTQSDIAKGKGKTTIKK